MSLDVVIYNKLKQDHEKTSQLIQESESESQNVLFQQLEKSQAVLSSILEALSTKVDEHHQNLSSKTETLEEKLSTISDELKAKIAKIPLSSIKSIQRGTLNLRETITRDNSEHLTLFENNQHHPTQTIPIHPIIPEKSLVIIEGLREESVSSSLAPDIFGNTGAGKYLYSLTENELIIQGFIEKIASYAGNKNITTSYFLRYTIVEYV